MTNPFIQRVIQAAKVKDSDLITHDYEKGDVVTFINSPTTRSLHGKKCTVIKPVWRDDGKYVTVSTPGVEATIHVKLIDTCETK